ncbi:MAG: transporter substrate-binding domain-containing protein, partial [Oscillospiraceae bacterium]
MIKRIITLIFTLCIFLNSTYIFASSEKEDTITVKVGWHTARGQQYFNEDGERTGYYYDYLQEISKYSNINYEFVDATWSECVKMLKNGDIDILCGVNYSDERSQYMNFSDLSVGYSHCILVIQPDNYFIIQGDKSTYNGKTIGYLKDCYDKDNLINFMEKNNFQCNLEGYSTYEEIYKALKLKNIDMMLTTNFDLNKVNYISVEQFSSTSLYIAVNKQKTELLNKINNAINCIETYEENYINRLSEKYFLNNGYKMFDMTIDEARLLKKIKKMEFISTTPRGYMSYYDDKNICGINYDLSILLSDINHEKMLYTAIDYYPDDFKKLELNDGSVYCGYNYDYNQAQRDGLFLSSPYMELKYYQITNMMKSVPIEKERTVAAVKGSTFLKDYITKKYDENQIKWYNSEAECFKAVSSGECDLTYCDTVVGDYLLSDLKQNKLIAKQIPIKSKICFATKDRNMASLLSKSLYSIGTDGIEKIIYKNLIIQHQQDSFARLFYSNPVATIITFSTIV